MLQTGVVKKGTGWFKWGGGSPGVIPEGDTSRVRVITERSKVKVIVNCMAPTVRPF